MEQRSQELHLVCGVATNDVRECRTKELTGMRDLSGGIEVAVQAGDMLGEGPVWDERSGQLVWVDISRCLVEFLDTKTNASWGIDVGELVSAVIPRSSGGFVLLRGDGLATLTTDRRVEHVISLPSSTVAVRTNDGNCDSAGRLWVGTMGLRQEAGAGALYRVSEDWSVRRMLDNVTISNGIGWSPDDALMYYIDSVTRTVDVFDFDAGDGKIENRRVFVKVVESGSALPDGLTVDEDGCVWVAVWGGGVVHRYEPDGRLDRVVQVPTPNVTSCAFAGSRLDELYITSAREDLPAGLRAAEGIAGALFRHRSGVRGRRQPAFRG
jgi:sugar lactone lactonase YvrE